jgi:2-(1,2-epoxy-1,2-dihydrophenyl)acetyl-CoA isomerase
MEKLGTLRLELQDDIGVITIDRPKAANCVNRLMAEELKKVAHLCASNSSLRAVVLTAEGRFFCGGGDINELSAFGDTAEREMKLLADQLHDAISTFSRMRAPLITAVNGVAAGAGFSLAAVGDIVLAAASASFTMAYTGVGLSPDGSSSYYLPRVIGLRRTQELMLTNRTLCASEAQGMGLVTSVVPDVKLASSALEMARTLARRSPATNAAIKELLLVSYRSNLEEQMELEGRHIARCAGSPNGQEGMLAFKEKREPRFV